MRAGWPRSNISDQISSAELNFYALNRPKTDLFSSNRLVFRQFVVYRADYAPAASGLKQII